MVLARSWRRSPRRRARRIKRKGARESELAIVISWRSDRILRSTLNLAPLEHERNDALHTLLIRPILIRELLEHELFFFAKLYQKLANATRTATSPPRCPNVIAVARNMASSPV